MDARDFDKEEFTSLRAESQFHQVNASAVFALNVTGLGIAVAAASMDSPVALPIVALLTSILWVRYLDHLIAIFRVAAYLTCQLRPRLRELDDRIFAWEEFLRSADPEDDRKPSITTRGKHLVTWATPTGSGESVPDTTRLPPLGMDSRKGIDVATLAFIIPPPVLILWYFYHLSMSPLPGLQRGLSIALALAGLVGWYLALVRTRRMARQIAAIDARIKKAIEKASAHTAPEPSTTTETSQAPGNDETGTDDQSEEPRHRCE